jgi:hypothetical protein
MVLHKNLTQVHLHIPKTHTHVEADVTDLDKYTQAAVDALLAAKSDTGHTHTSGDIPSLSNYVPKTAGSGESFSGHLYLDQDLQVDGNAYVKSGNWYRIGTKGGGYRNVLYYQSSNDSIYVGTTGDGCILQGKNARPSYTQVPFGSGTQLALLSDVTGVGSFLPLSGGTMSGAIDMGSQNITNIATLNSGFGNFSDNVLLTTNNKFLYGRNASATNYRTLIGLDASDIVQVGHASHAIDLNGSLTRPTYNTAALALRTDIGTDAPASHTHTVSDVTDIGSNYLALTGGVLSGNLQFSDDGEGIQFHTGSNYFFGMKVDRGNNQLVIGGDTSVDWGGYAKVNIETFELDIGSSNAAFTGLYGYDATVADFVGLIRLEGPDAADLSFAHGDAGISLAGKNVQIGAAGEWAADADGVLQISNGNAPTGSITDGVVLYAEDVAASSELKVRDEAGNVTTLSPHNFTGTEPSEKMAWAFHSEKDGEYVTVDMMQVVRLVEKMAGQKLVHTGEVDV